MSENIRLVTAFSALALVPMITAHVIGAATVNPLIDPISWYAFVPGGGLMIIAGGSLLALLGLLLMVRMYRTGVATGPVPAVAMIIFSISLVLVGVCPTDPPTAGASISDGTLAATIHRICAGSAFATLPVIGLSLARTIDRPVSRMPRMLCRSAYGLAGLVALFLSIHLPLAFAGSGIAAFGFIERAGFVIMIGYLFLLAATIDRESGARTAAVQPIEAPASVLPAGPVEVPVLVSRRAGDYPLAGASVAEPSIRRHTSSHGVGASPSLVSASVESTT
ncbi:DUF998 domain-containing protein [Microlunatus soli]|uniref:DUF998 domain-containing protein n=1 Tax=Microlunatus soli TaxID=630515 RepID=UPI0012F74EC9|nr:DUF998 domain-containing protein [Microlunatus soli]